MTDKIVIFVAVGNSKDAALLAKSLVEKRLAACVNLVPGISSWYWWEGKVNRGPGGVVDDENITRQVCCA